MKNLFNALSIIAFIIALNTLSCSSKSKKTSYETQESKYEAKEMKHEIGKIVDVSTTKDEWVQEHYIIVEGTLKDIWNYYTSSEAMRTHVAPFINVDFRNGGKWEASYNLSAKLGDSENFINEVINVIPYRQFSTKGIRAPFDIEAMKSLRSTMMFEDLGDNKIKVSAITTGWMGITDVDYRKKVFEMSGKTNPEILKCLNVRLTQGPLNWEKILNQN